LKYFFDRNRIHQNNQILLKKLKLKNMSGFITVIRKNGRNTNGRNTNGHNTNGRNTNGRNTKVHPFTDGHKTNKFETFNEKSFPTPERALSKPWKRAPIGQWGKRSSLVVEKGSFVQKKRQYTKVQAVKDCRYCHENHDIKDKSGEITCPKLLRKLEYEGNQKKQVQKERKSHKELAQIERTNAWAEKLRQQFAAAEIHTQDEVQCDDSDDDSSDEEYDLSLQPDEEQCEEQREKELLAQKRLNRIKEVEVELAEARAELEEETKSNDCWADAGDIEDLELRIECLEEKLERLKNK